MTRELNRHVNGIMDDIHHNHDKLPVLTEIVRAESIAPGDARQGVVNLRLAIIDSDPRGYDPYNNAPPVPADEEAVRQ